jgi:hypothetical protein
VINFRFELKHIDLLASQNVKKDAVAAKKREREALSPEDLLVAKQQERERKKLKKETASVPKIERLRMQFSY